MPDHDRFPPPGGPSPVRPFLTAGGNSGGVEDRYRSPASDVRPYLLTGGRARPVDSGLRIEAQVLTTPQGAAALDRHQYEHHAILTLCLQPKAVAEVGARLGLHLGVARILVADLVVLGHLAVRAADHSAVHSVHIIERLIRGLQAIG